MPIAKNKNIFLIKRPKRLGIGSAHKVGLKWGYKRKYKGKRRNKPKVNEN